MCQGECPAKPGSTDWQESQSGRAKGAPVRVRATDGPNHKWQDSQLERRFSDGPKGEGQEQVAAFPLRDRGLSI